MTEPTAPIEATAHFPPDGSSASGARRFVAATLEAWDLVPLDEVASLLVSELVSNVVLHAETELDLHVRRSGGRVRVEVHDRSPRLPERKFYSVTAATGRGLVFVAELAQAWGADPTATGKSVWFELDETPPAPPPTQAADTELRLEDWEDSFDWDDLPPPAAPDGPPSAPDATPAGSSARLGLRSVLLCGAVPAPAAGVP